MNKISSSSIRTYSECARKYELHYVERLRAKTISGALLFGSAIDNGLNFLLQNPTDLPGANAVFEKMWNFQYINNVYTNLPQSDVIVYADKDFDGDLLLDEDRKKFNPEFPEGYSVESRIQVLKDLKSENGFENLDGHEKEEYNLGHWLCLR